MESKTYINEKSRSLEYNVNGHENSHENYAWLIQNESLKLRYSKILKEKMSDSIIDSGKTVSEQIDILRFCIQEEGLFKEKNITEKTLSPLSDTQIQEVKRLFEIPLKKEISKPLKELKEQKLNSSKPELDISEIKKNDSNLSQSKFRDEGMSDILKSSKLPSPKPSPKKPILGDRRSYASPKNFIRVKRSSSLSKNIEEPPAEVSHLKKFQEELDSRIRSFKVKAESLKGKEEMQTLYTFNAKETEATKYFPFNASKMTKEKEKKENLPKIGFSKTNFSNAETRKLIIAEKIKENNKLLKNIRQTQTAFVASKAPLIPRKPHTSSTRNRSITTHRETSTKLSREQRVEQMRAKFEKNFLIDDKAIRLIKIYNKDLLPKGIGHKKNISNFN